MTGIYLEVSGRMGNHLFQYWVARWLSDHLGGWPIYYWCHDYQNYMPRCLPNIRYIERPDLVLAARDDPEVVTYTDNPSQSPGLLDLPGMVALHRASRKPIRIRAYMEDYAVLRGYETYIRHLYYIPGVQRRDTMAIHIRLGDIADKNAPAIPAYQRYILACCARYQRPVEVYTDDPNHPLTRGLLAALYASPHCPAVGISNTASYDPSLDLVLMAGVSTLVMMNSTFSWWAAFLGQNRPRVHVGLSAHLGNSFRRDCLFLADTTSGWELYDLDTETLLRPLETMLVARPAAP